MHAHNFLDTAIMRRMLSRMTRTHERRRSSVFVGPPGIGKSTAIEALRASDPRNILVTTVMKRGITGPQVLQQLLSALSRRRSQSETHLKKSAREIDGLIKREIEYIGGGLRRDDNVDNFPLVTVVFDEAQRLTNSAIDALRDYNEPHYFCAGTFPIGMIFVGNNELSLQVGAGGASILDEGMNDRLLYRDRYSYEDVERADLEQFVRSQKIGDEGAVAAIVAAFAAPRTPRSFRRMADIIDDMRDEAHGAEITRETVQAVLG